MFGNENSSSSLSESLETLKLPRCCSFTVLSQLFVIVAALGRLLTLLSVLLCFGCLLHAEAVEEEGMLIYKLLTNLKSVILVLGGPQCPGLMSVLGGTPAAHKMSKFQERCPIGTERLNSERK